MSKFGRLQDPNKRALNKILRENKYDPKDPYRLFREESKKQKKREKLLSKPRRQKPVKFNLTTILVWIIIVLFLHFIEK
jgi:hypothetical protein